MYFTCICDALTIGILDDQNILRKVFCTLHLEPKGKILCQA